MRDKKLTGDEVNAFFSNFQIVEPQIRALSSQKSAFMISFVFINLYAMVFIIFHSFFPETMINLEEFPHLEAEYKFVLDTRSAVGMVLLCFFNLAFFFTNFFMFVAILALTYLITATYSLIVVFGPFLTFETLSLATLHYWFRPLAGVALLVCIMTFNPER